MYITRMYILNEKLSKDVKCFVLDESPWRTCKGCNWIKLEQRLEEKLKLLSIVQILSYHSSFNYSINDRYRKKIALKNIRGIKPTKFGNRDMELSGERQDWDNSDDCQVPGRGDWINDKNCKKLVQHLAYKNYFYDSF